MQKQTINPKSTAGILLREFGCSLKALRHAERHASWTGPVGQDFAQAAQDLRTVAKLSHRPYHFVRVHMPTGSRYPGEFNGSHHELWADEAWRDVNACRLAVISQALITHWNARYSENDVWRYQLVEGPCPANVHQ